MSKNKFKIMSFVFRWGGIAAMVFALYLFADNAYFWLRADSVTGTVVAQEEMKSPRTNDPHVPHPTSIYREKAFAPEIAFKTAGGEEITFVSNIGYGKHFAFHDGEEVPVLYLSSSPQTAKVYSLLELFMLPVVLFVFGGVFWVVGIIAQFMAESSEKK